MYIKRREGLFVAVIVLEYVVVNRTEMCYCQLQLKKKIALGEDRKVI